MTVTAEKKKTRDRPTTEAEGRDEPDHAFGRAASSFGSPNVLVPLLRLTGTAPVWKKTKAKKGKTKQNMRTSLTRYALGRENEREQGRKEGRKEKLTS